MSAPLSKPGHTRTALVGGPYVLPIVKLGDRLEDEIDGSVEVGGYSSGPIPWPRRLKSGRASLILCADLARAVRTESALAIAHHFGVSTMTVQKWRAALGVDRKNNKGTQALYRKTIRERSSPLTGDEATAVPRPTSGIAKTSAERKKAMRDRKGARGEPRVSVDLTDEARAKASQSAKAAGMTRTQWVNALILRAP